MSPTDGPNGPYGPIGPHGPNGTYGPNGPNGPNESYGPKVVGRALPQAFFCFSSEKTLPQAFVPPLFISKGIQTILPQSFVFSPIFYKSTEKR